MPGTYYDPTVAYGSGGLDRETGQNYPAALYQRLMDMLEFITGGSGTWTDFTPTLTQSGAVTITVTSARYKINGTTVTLQCELPVTAAGTAGNAITIASIPAAIAPRAGAVALAGVFEFVDASTGIFYVGVPLRASASTITGGRDAGTGAMGVDPNLALASGDTIRLAAVYEIA